MKKIALVTMHGMGKYKPSYYSKLEEALKKQLEYDWAAISFHPVDYGMDLQVPEDAFWESVVSCKSNSIKNKELREFFLYGFGDAGSLEHGQGADKPSYLASQLSILQALNQALIGLGNDSTKPVIIIAQSLGCQVIANFIWDAQNKLNIFGPEGSVILQSCNLTEFAKTDFAQLKTLKNLITTGCNIPVFVAGLTTRQCFDKPNTEFVWDNLYDANDVMGWPLRQLGESYEIVNDHPINSGNALTSWNLACHGAYWADKNVQEHLAGILSQQIHANEYNHAT